MIDLSQVYHPELVLQPVGRLIDQANVIGCEAVRVPDLKTPSGRSEPDVCNRLDHRGNLVGTVWAGVG